MREVIDRPGRLYCELHHSSEVQPERDSEAGALIALSVAASDAVDGEHHDLNASPLGASHHLTVEAAVLVEVELVDLRAVADPARLLKADGSKGGNAEHRPVLARRRRHGALALVVEQSLQRSRRAVHRHREPLAHDDHRHVYRLYAPQDVRDEVASLKGAGVAPIGGLIVRRAVDVVEDRTRQAALGEPPEVVEVVAILDAHLEGVSIRAPGEGANTRMIKVRSS